MDLLKSLLLLVRGAWKAIAICLAIIAASVSLAQAADDLTLYHPSVTTKLTTQGSDGHQLGDLRVASIQVNDAGGKALGRLDVTLLTTAIDTPSPGDEVRISELVFTLDGGDVIIIGGSGLYPKQASTFKAGTSLVRPIKGTAGKLAGLTGWCESMHLEDGSCTHTFHFTKR